MNTRRKLQFAIVVILFFAAGFAGAQQPASTIASQAAALGLNQAIPVNSAITVGTLPNGLRYYIRANKQPLKRAELRLVVRAGSILEDDDQQGLAHFVEHMAFNGTTHFPGESVVAFLQSTGMRFGADVNAGTGFDETTYMLTVPTDKADVMDKSFLVLEDWAHNVSFDAKEIDQERGVIIEEWRLRRGAGARTQDKEFPILLKGSRYADRIPIGKTEIIQNFKPEVLKRFYADWYRPDLMAVVAVGDFDPVAIEALIKTHFAPIPSPRTERKRIAYDVPNHSGTIYAIITDKETTETSIEIDNLLPARKKGTVGAYRQELVDSLFTNMLSQRFSEIGEKPDAPFVFAGAGRGQFIARSKDTAALFAQAKEGAIEQATDTLIAEAERVRRFGFTQTELDRQKQGILRSFERMVAQKQDRPSASHAAEYIRNFLTNEPLPGVELEYALHQRFVPGIMLDELNKLSKEWFGSSQNRLVIVEAPDKSGLKTPTEPQIATAIKAATAKTLTAYVDTVGSQALMDSMPQPGAVSKVSTIPPGVTQWDLSNGAKVLLMPTMLKADDIVFRATSWGGTSLAGDADYIPASTAVQLVTAGGLGKFNSIDLGKTLTGKVASAGPFISELQEGLSGGSSRKDIETMFQLIYLDFTAPRSDPTAFATQAAQEKSFLVNQTAAPSFAFSKTLTDTLYQGHVRRQVETLETVDKWNLQKSLAFYKDRFSDASDFTFMFVGDFDLATMKPLVERYIASLPATHRQETWKDVGVRMPKGVIEKTVEKGIEPRSQVAIVFNGPFQSDQQHRIAIDAMAQVLQERLRETIREELGGTYSITAGSGSSKFPVSEFRFTVQFGCDPQKAADLTKRVYQEIEKFKNEGPTAQQTSVVKETLLRTYETNSRQNGYLLGQIAGRLQNGDDIAGYLQYPDDYRKLDSTAIQQAARTYLDLSNHIQVTLMPEKK